jgi:hypothetical protein
LVDIVFKIQLIFPDLISSQFPFGFLILSLTGAAAGGGGGGGGGAIFKKAAAARKVLRFLARELTPCHLDNLLAARKVAGKWDALIQKRGSIIVRYTLEPGVGSLEPGTDSDRGGFCAEIHTSNRFKCSNRVKF